MSAWRRTKSFRFLPSLFRATVGAMLICMIGCAGGVGAVAGEDGDPPANDNAAVETPEESEAVDATPDETVSSNKPPVALDKSHVLLTGVANSTLNVIQLGATDPDSTRLTFVVDTLPTGGGKLFDLRAAGPGATLPHEQEITLVPYRMELGGNRLRYRPGPDTSADSFTWHANDGESNSNDGKITISFDNWFPPPGVPNPMPAFDFRRSAPTLPDPWEEEAVGFYCVANDGDDVNALGTPAKPRQSIPNPIPAGSVVVIHGTYDFVGGGNKIVIVGEGTQADPIFLVGMDGVLRDNLTISGSWVIVDGLEFDSSGANVADIAISGDTDHVVVRHCEMHGFPQLPQGQAVVINGGNGATCRDVVIFDNDIHDNGNFDVASGENDIHGVTVRNDTERIWIMDNRMYRNGGDGVQINFGAGTPTSVARQTYIARNLMHHNREDAVDIKGSSQVVVSQNIAYGYRITGSSGAFPFLPHAQQNRPQQIWILFNEVFDAEGGIRANDVDGVYIIGNIVHGVRSFDTNSGPNNATRGGCGIQARNCEQVYVYGNTIYDAETGIAMLDLANGAAVHIVDNLITHMVPPAGTSDGYRHILVNDEQHGGAYWDNSDIDHNLLFQPGDDPVRVRWRNMVFQSVRALVSGLRGDQGTGMLQADPRINFHDGGRISADSPAVDAGVYPFDANDPAAAANKDFLSVFMNTFNVSIRVDIENQPRPSDRQNWDIGAYEKQ